MTAPAGNHRDDAEHPLAPFYRAWGYRTWSRLGTLWIASGRFSVVSVPCSRPVAATRQEVERLLEETGRLAAQFPSASRTGVERSGYWVRDRGYGPASLQRQFRQHVLRHGARRVVRPVAWGELAARGQGVLRDAFARKPGPWPADRGAWEACCRDADAIPRLAATGCFVDGTLAAFLVSWVSGRECHVLMYHRSPRFDALRPSHALIADFTSRTIRRDDVEAVTLGRDLIPALGAVGEFKRHAGYRPEPTPVAAVIAPRWRGLLTHPWARGALRGLHRLGGRRAGPLGNVDVLDVAAITRLPPGRGRP